MKCIVKAIIALSAVASRTDAFSSSSSQEPRRAFLSKLQKTVIAAPAALIAINPSMASAAVKDDLLNDLNLSKEKMAPVKQLLEAGEWDKVRTILKTPPVNQLWNLGESKNTLVRLAKETGDFEILELKDELAISLQMCDQLTYDNAFVYYQPGDGKVKIKEPVQLAEKAIAQIGEAISIISN
mmetsp:Transcript_14355/g.21080  ORF Transcript_14355/g.21080 Transcript_14355/m.21080 type:complete len:183 (-) Transcript_14355:1103-1651(-)|eukprot:CAMPEP_0197250444 /NCGR_PEP_ID=MMETSP1429-20130617/52780_1 /TAXON_ID=49237 /ORGANISM="Chaetoceros  sp., Strain UNC1202" /LENGTH=182 /DNA_ID=CAMNT_0042712269 /DNA_START=104 /DNA_END=652 /DNA_ORIENTATION=+